MAEERYDLNESRRSVRELYPVLLDAHGNVIDGYHRLRADPDWRTEMLDHIRTKTQLVLARIIANTHRRSVSREEREEQVNELAKCLVGEGVAKDEIIPAIAELTTFTDRYVRELLSEEYKRSYKAPAKSELSSEFEKLATEEYDKALWNIGIAVPRGMPEPPSLDAISEEEAPEPGPKPEEESAPMDFSEDEAPAQPPALEYTREYFRHYLRPDEEFLAWDLCRRYGVSDREAHRIIADVKAEKTGKPESRRTQPIREEPQAPTCRCPLCGRDGADKLLILTNFVEDATMAQMTLFDFVSGALRH